ncbi:MULTISPECIES: TonB-dependent hemoglobin/transferrin/lactoferrin family receptor [unclassified Rhizobium]|uniref:TonB-dependent hemoglobin/transferrin/lactoferrin family receptor n=1 Tax=unclassified Rhizobium TaxID=2613769 RepID=UPI002478B1E7|nr:MULTISPECIES: TonB-dependent hemoglobin/transferrin/lactoferrin family receptor [unclassified Rhizobium]MDH7801596.1 hemoglobin/transferrin/lactoferrin receptor protein [Rhizobium sp. AN70]
MSISRTHSALLLCTAMSLLPFAGPAQSQDAASQTNGTTTLEKIVVKGKRVKSANAVADTPLASQTTAEDIRKKDIGSIKDLGNSTEPGVDYVDAKPGRPGGLFIRGLGGARVVTLIDNIPVPFFENFARQGQATTTLSNTNSSFDFSSLSTVDVVRGADSSRIGSGALGGALVLRTLEPEDLIGEGRDWGGVAKTTYDSEDRSVGGSLAVAKKIENTSVLFQGSYKRGNETDNKGFADVYGIRRTKPNPADTYESNLMFKIRQDLEGGHRIGLTAERYSLRDRSDMRTLQGVSVTGTGSTYRIGDYRGYEDTERDRVSLDYEYEAPSTDSLIDAANLSLYWTRLSKESGAGDRLTNNSLYIREDSMRNSAFGIVGGLESGFELGGVQHTVRFGGNAMTTDFSQELYANTGGVTSSSQSDMPDVSGKSLGLYLDDEIAFGNGFRLTPGLRFDSYDYDPDGSVASNGGYRTFGLPSGNSGSRFSPKLLATYDVTPELQLFAQWSMAYRAPTINELYLNFSNISSGYAVVGNSTLNPETSNGFEIGANYASGDLTGSLTLFHNKYKNFIEQYTTTSNLFSFRGSAGNLFTYRNRNNVEISGVEAKVRKELANGFFAHASLAYAYGKDTDTNQFIRTVAPFKSVLGVGYAQETWGTEFTGIFSSHMRDDNVPTTYDAPGYGIFNLTGWWEPEQTKGLRIQAGVYNLFDKQYWNAVGVRDVNPNAVSTVNQPVDFYTEAGRTFKISLTQKF